jgi:hypothetical protein
MNNGKTKISSYVIDRRKFDTTTRNNYKTAGHYNATSNPIEKCSKDISELFGTIDFPYRRDYLGDASIKINLEKIFEIEPIIKKEKWEIPDGKIISKIPIFKQLYYLLDVVITSVNDHWQYDQVIDHYSEEARVKTPGYGEKYSPYEYWNNDTLHQRWLPNKNYFTLEEVRELIYEKVQEARPAYSLVSKSLYTALMELNIRDSYKILDIAAYGERAISAASLSNVIVYDGIDPNYDLIHGHNLLSMDLNTLNPDCQIRFIHIGMEDFKTSRKYDIITYSPPPFNTEPYGLSSETNKTQSYIKYPTFEEYFCCFLTELIYKAKMYSNENAIFSFTALDRNPIKFPPKILDKKQISEHLELIYVEALLLITSCFGFHYQGAIGLAAGGKRAGVPWWTFRFTNSIEPIYLQLLQEHYPNLFERIAPRIIANYHSVVYNIHPLFEEYVTITKTDEYYISSYLPKRTNIFLELIRLQIQQYVIEVINKLTGMRIEKIRVLLGRYLMMRSINSTYNEPWKSCLYVDPVFPTKDNNSGTPIEKQILEYFIEQRVSSNLANSIVYTYKYWFGSYECEGLTNLYHIIANYIQTIPISNVKVSIEKKNGMTIINGNEEAVNILKNIPKGQKICGITSELWKGKPDIRGNSTEEMNLLAYLRYETLGAHGHQYTRPIEKTAIIQKIFKMPIIDIYASIYNNQSDKYCSIYPDVEENSIGSAFCLRMIEGAYLANPVDVPVFLEKSLSIIIDDLNRAKQNDKNLLISMGFTVWTDVEDYFIKDFGNDVKYSELFKKSSNIGLQILAESEFVLAVYILDKKKFPSILLDKVGNRDNTISVGVILGSKINTINYDKLTQLVEDKKYVQYNKHVNI